jgi:predicted deacetylase
VLPRTYLAELHDIHPGMVSRLDDMLAALPAPAREHAAVLVVPNWQGHFPLDCHPDFCRRVARLPGPIVLHGCTHSAGRNWWNTFWYGHDNRSEFAHLSRKEARRLLDQGRAAIERQVGSSPQWFCAPRWHEGKSTTEALADAGFAGSLRRDRIALTSGAAAKMPVIGFDEGERRWKTRLAVRLREGVIARTLARGRPFRLVLHPSDLDDAPTWEQAMRLITGLETDGWTPVSLDDIVRQLEGGATETAA